MKYESISRRELARALGIGGLATFLPSLRRPAWAASGAPPKRVVFFYTQHGVLRPLWEPTGSPGSNFQFGTLQKPLETLKSKAVLISGLDFTSFTKFGGGSNGHREGEIHALTSSRPGSVEDRAGGISIDQFLAKEINRVPVTLLPSIQLAIQGNGDNGSKVNATESPSFSAPNQAVPYDMDALKLFAKIFPNGTVPGGTTAIPPAGPDPAILRHRSVLDFVAKEFQSEAARLSPRQRTKLQAHGEAIRAAELKLALAEMGGGGGAQPTKGCALPSKTGINTGIDKASDLASYKIKTEARLRMIQAALACDVTRVVSLYVSMPPVSGLAGSPNQHDLCHRTSDQASGSGVSEIVAAQVAYFEMFAKLGKLLDEIPEGDGTLLDHTALLWCGQISNGNHDKKGHRWTMLGSLGGSWPTGRYLKVNGIPHSNLFVSIARGMGININSFGAPEACTGPLTDLGGV